MNYKKSYWLCFMGFILSIFIMLFGCGLEMYWIVLIGLAVLGASIVQAAVFYRCPHCNNYLNIRARRPKHCPECGREIEW